MANWTPCPKCRKWTWECCGQHEVCEKEQSLLAAVSKKIEYYDDEELDKYIGTAADQYTPEQEEELRDVFSHHAVRRRGGRVCSPQLRGIALPDNIKDEVFLIVGERRKITNPRRMELLQYTFFQHALIGSLLASIVCGIIGTYIVTRRLVFISGGLTRVFCGIGLGLYAGISPILSAAVFSVLSAFGVEWLSKRRGHARGLCHCGILDVGNGIGHHIHIPISRICTRPFRLSVRKHPDYYI